MRPRATGPITYWMESTSPVSPRQFAVVNAAISSAVVGFLVWLVYFHQGDSSAGGDSVLPAWNALFNTMSAGLTMTRRPNGVSVTISRRSTQRNQRRSRRNERT